MFSRSSAVHYQSFPKKRKTNMNCVFDNNVLLLCPITMFTCSVTCNSFRKLIWCTNCFGFEIFVLIIRVLFDYSYIDPACQYIWCRYGIVYQTTDVEMFICTRDTERPCHQSTLSFYFVAFIYSAVHRDSDCCHNTTTNTWHNYIFNNYYRHNYTRLHCRVRNNHKSCYRH